jgi:membrane-associated protease RseP (regulator of RpoE activity)
MASTPWSSEGTTVTDDTPAGEDEAAEQAGDTGAAAGDSGALDAGGEAVTSPGDAPEASSSASATSSEDATGAAGETPDAGTAAEPATVDAAAAPAASAAAAPSTRERRGVFVPTWLAVLVAVLLVGGIGFGIGYAAADGDDSNSSNAAAVQPGQQNPGSGSTLPGAGTVPDNDNPGNESVPPTAFLGVTVESAENDGGARISNVRPGSPAADAGLQSGDVVTEVGDATVEDDDDLIRAVRSHDPGDEVTITYTRDGTSHEVTVELGDRSDATRSAVPS